MSACCLTCDSLSLSCPFPCLRKTSNSSIKLRANLMSRIVYCCCSILNNSNKKIIWKSMWAHFYMGVLGSKLFFCNFCSFNWTIFELFISYERYEEVSVLPAWWQALVLYFLEVNSFVLLLGKVMPEMRKINLKFFLNYTHLEKTQLFLLHDFKNKLMFTSQLMHSILCPRH